MNCIDKLINDTNKLKEAYSLLEEIWLECGPYGSTYSRAIRYKLQDFFGFDDSE